MAIYTLKYINEYYKNETEIVFNNKSIKVKYNEKDENCEKDVIIFTNHFKQIIKVILKYFYDYYKEYCKNDDPVKKWKKADDLEQYMHINKIQAENSKTSKFDSVTTFLIDIDLDSNILKNIHDDHVPSIHYVIRDHKYDISKERFEMYHDG